MQNKKYIIYVHRNKVNNKCYVGQTCQTTRQRWGMDGCGYKREPKFYNAICKYGWDNFEHIILEKDLTLDQSNQLEKEYIVKFNSRINGYNLTDGGDGSLGYSASQEAREKISKSQQGRFTGSDNPFYGKHHSLETKQKISQIQKGHKMTLEHKDKLKLANTGRKHTPEECDKIRQAAIGRKRPPISEETREKLRLAISNRKRDNKGRLI